MDINTYEAQADTIDVDDIATNSNNRIVMRRIKRNYANYEDNEYLSIRNVYQNGEECTCYFPEGIDDMGWLGYFIGKNQHLQKLVIRSFTPMSEASVRDVMEPFLRGVSRNKSIREIIFLRMDLLGGGAFTMLSPFFKNNHNLTHINVNNCVLEMRGYVCLLWLLGVVHTKH